MLVKIGNVLSSYILKPAGKPDVGQNDQKGESWMGTLWNWTAVPAGTYVIGPAIESLGRFLDGLFLETATLQSQK